MVNLEKQVSIWSHESNMLKDINLYVYCLKIDLSPLPTVGHIFYVFFMNTKKFSDQYKLFLILSRPQCMVTLKLLQLHFSCFFPVNLTKFPISNNLPAIRISISMRAAMDFDC